MSYCTLSGCVSRRPAPPVSVGKPAPCRTGLGLDHFMNSSPAATQRCVSQPRVAPLFFSCTDQWLSERVSTRRWLDFVPCTTGPTFFPSVLLVPAPHESPSSHKYAHTCTILCAIVFRTIRSRVKSNRKLNVLRLS